MIVFLYGQDTYRSRRKLNEIIGHYKKTHQSGLNLTRFDGDENNFEELRDELRQTPMFKEKKLIVLENVFSNNDFKEKLLKYSKSLVKSENIILFFEGGKILEKDRLLRLLKENGKIQKFELLEGAALRKWIKNEFESWGAKSNMEAVEKLISFVGNDSWQLSNEIKKLASYRNGQEIQAQDIELLVSRRVETDIFKTIDAIASKNKNLALTLLKKHLQRGDSPLYLLTMISYQFRNLLLVKSSELQKLKLHPFVVRKSTAQARKFTIEELKKIYRKIFEADLNIKTGKIEPQVALDLLITEI